MPPKKEAPVVVDIESSDDEGSVEVVRRVADDDDRKPAISNAARIAAIAPPPPPPPAAAGDGLESRSFWKAGNYAVAPDMKLASDSSLLEYARVHPKFLHSNATSHKWAFGAIAELLDNAVDEIRNGATFVKIDKIDILKDNSPALLIQDDGGGMDPDGIRKCMSLGYSSKKSNTTIGQYGNGFKTSTMRLGADVIVFTRAIRAGRATQSIGLLSYTFLRTTGQDDVIVPMIDFDISGHWTEPIIYGSKNDWSANLQTILEWSPFASRGDLMQQFEDIGLHGTKVLIYNLWLNDEGIYELSFDDDEEDIMLRDEANQGSATSLNKRTAAVQAHISYRLRYSLRAYASILYLRKFTNFKILLRGKPVDQYIIADDLKYSKVVSYKPLAAAASKEVAVETTIGFIKEVDHVGICGFNVYHKNRLIRPFWKVTSDGSSKGYGVVGVLEANFIEPAHDKQDFERSSLFIRLEAKLKQILSEYWKSYCHLIGYQPPGFKAQKVQKGNLSPMGVETNAQKQSRESHHLASVYEGVQLNPSTVSVAANVRRVSIDGQSNNRKELSVNQPIVGSAMGSENASTNGIESMSLDQICDENLQLFMRLQGHKEKETELLEMIQKVEKELEETRRKCASLSSYIETQRKQNLLQQHARKV
ncbi:protein MICRORCHIDIA 2 isoform X1 [Eucalyptus grandis]|uniref:protein MICRORCHIDIA 2 isoform X1 n=1 Tax=Eucalyptus grandis TaxID=71139 RepID=UPI00192EA6F1|nr:protein MICRORCHIDIA 2 isoform X1 [Eucalyptus grandis]